jgi:hypothetical protein
MRLGLFINPTGHHQASWRHPDADADAGVDFGHYLQWFTAGAADGFNLQPAYFPGMFEEFVDGVMPELRERGLVRDGYRGRTLRDHFELPRPAWGGRSVFGAIGQPQRRSSSPSTRSGAST